MGIDALIAAAPRKAIFLDRDGVLNHAVVRDGRPYPPLDLASLRIYGDAEHALAVAKNAGFALIVVTNQPDVARGTQRRDVVESIHASLSRALPLDAIFACYHDSADECACRKPKPGLISEAARRHAIDLGSSFLIGDRWRDIDAGAAAGVKTILIDRGYAEREASHAPDARVPSLGQAISWILEESYDTNVA